MDLIKLESKVEKMHIDVIEKTSKSLLCLLNEILDISKIEQNVVNIEFIPYSVNEIISDVKSVFESNAKIKDVDITCVFLQDEIINLGDPGKINQIMTNFLTNAIKFTKKNGLIKMVVDKVDDYVIYSVSDNGLGIEKTNIHKLFEEYAQVHGDKSFGGTGLGLSISRKLAKLMNGEIGCKSDGLNLGSTFWLKLPLKVQNVEKQLHLKPDRFLIVEDTIYMQLILNKFLHKLGHTDIVICDNGLDAWNLLQIDKSFSIIFIDNVMPKMCGKELGQKIKNIQDYSPVLVWMSAENDQYTQNIFDKILQKPINLEELRDIVTQS